MLSSPTSVAACWRYSGVVSTPEYLQQAATDVGEESIVSRTGGAPTLAMGMAHILHNVFRG
ncbi:hypothetical protein DN549_33770, partial [Burkholderia multivorans]|uniref:carbon starvation CstA family protein n=1 Tax=Burkholderia multivorans TaxID=87883 RepID=UPI000DB0DDD5